MKPEDPTQPALSLSEDVSRFAQRFLEHVQAVIVPYARMSGCAVAWVSQVSCNWLCSHDDCSCKESGCSGTEPSATYRLDVKEEQESGVLLICPGRHPSTGFQPLCAAAAMTLRQTELEFQEESLLMELAESWESLDTLYEISTNLRFLQQPEDLLEKILSRAVSATAGAHAILWIEKSGMLEPMASCNWDYAIPRSLDSGLVGKAISTRSTLTALGHQRVVGVDDLERELSAAESVIIVPIATQQGLIGALQVWEDRGQILFDSPRVRLVEALALQATVIVERDRSLRASIESERLQNEIEVGARIQRLLLSAQPPELPRLQIEVLNEPSRYVAGDFYDFVEQVDGVVDVFMGDVMGKGVPAALAGAATKTNLLRAAARQASDPMSMGPPSPAEVIGRVHDWMSRYLIKLESFVTLIYLRIDLHEGRITFVDCGHTPTLLYSARADSLTSLKGENLPLGFLESETFVEKETKFEQGDTLLVYSDGVTEALSPVGESFGEERLAAFLSSRRFIHPKEILSELQETLVSFSGSPNFSDDITCLAIQSPGPEGAFVIQDSREFPSDLKQLASLRSWIRNFLNRNRIDVEESCGQLELAATEVMSNIIRHAYRERQGEEKICVEAKLTGNRVELTLTHWGEGFVPQSFDLPPEVEEVNGGFGLYIISRMVDDVDFQEDTGSGSRIRLRKTILPEGQENKGK